MADNTTNNSNPSNNSGFITDQLEILQLDELGLLRDIDSQLRNIIRNDGIRFSQSSLKDLMIAEQRNDVIIERRRKQRQGSANKQNASNASSNQASTAHNSTYQRNQRRNDTSNLFDFDRRTGRIRAGQMWDRVTEQFEDTLMQGLTGYKHPFDDVFKNMTDQFMKSLGVEEVDKLGPEVARRILGKLDNIPYKQLLGEHKNTSVGRQLREEINWFKDKANTLLNTGMSQITSSLGGNWENIDLFGQADYNVSDQNVNDFSEVIDATHDLADNVNDNFIDLLDNQQQVQDILNSNASNTIDVVTTSTDRIVNAIWQSSGGQGAPELGNEFDDQGDNTLPGGQSPQDLIDEVVSNGTSDIGDGVNDIIDNATDVVQDELPDLMNMLLNQGDDVIGGFLNTVTNAAGSTGALAGEAGAAAGGLEALGMAAPELIPIILLAGLAIEAISEQLKVVVGPAIQGVKDFIDGLTSAFNRDLTINSKYLELQRKRNEQDMKSIKEAAYKVIEDSANRAMQVWDSVETTIAASEVGENASKAGVQNLWSAYAQRLKEEGYASVVSSADIMEKLETVLKQGLQGAAAEEFAYQATLLSSAMPTEDFFQYASSYASIIANQIKAGQSQEAAINEATVQLRAFANNLLHANRDVEGGAGGLATSLVSASDLFAKSTQIAITGRSTETAAISQALTTLSGVVSAIAPDLAGNIVDAVYKAAVGGNSSEITALRSMANTGAANTSFLQSLLANPKQVLSTMFTNLAQLQNMSAANYMEVAEGLSEVFGMSMDAFARVDFNYLAQQINAMNNSSSGDNSISDQLALLASGQITANDSQFRIQKINEYMIEQGLAYVLDNQVARSIQEHMWEEQLAREIMEAMYSVDFAGGAKSLINGILNTLKGLADLINPVGWIKKVANVGLTAIEAAAQSKDLKQIIELGKVGEGNAEMFEALTTSGKDLHLATPIVELLGGVSEQNIVKDLLTLNDYMSNPLTAFMANGFDTNELKNAIGDIGHQVNNAFKGTFDKFGDILNNGTSAVKKYASDVMDTAQNLKNKASGITNSLIDKSKSIANSIDELTGGALSDLKNKYDVGMEAIKDLGKQAIEIDKKALGRVIDADKKALNTTVDATESALNAVADANKTALAAEKQAITDAMSAVTKSINSAKDKVKTGLSNIISNIGEATGLSSKAVEEATNNSYAMIDNYSSGNVVLAETGTILNTAMKGQANEELKAKKSYYNQSIVGKTIGSLISSGDWRTNSGYNPYYQNFGDSGTEVGTPTQDDAKTLSKQLNESIREYVNTERETASSLDNLRKEMTEDRMSSLIEKDAAILEEEGFIQHRGFYTNQDIVDAILAKSDELVAEEQDLSFEDWLDKFQKETGIGNLAAALSDYGEELSTIENMYIQEQAARQNALTKARDLHEVQFWEDMQQFATVDFPWYMREWERYYIQHEAYTEASNQAYQEAVALSVQEKGEMGDSVLALAEALTENSMWQEELGDKLKDPVVHTNVLLSKILLVVEAIMQQNNETSIVSVPTALSSLGLGLTNG